MHLAGFEWAQQRRAQCLHSHLLIRHSLSRAAPVLHVQDVKGTGRVLSRHSGIYLGFRRRRIRRCVAQTIRRFIWSGTIETRAATTYSNGSRNVDAYHQELVARGAEIASGPIDRPYGIRELAVRDINGMAIVFGQDMNRELSLERFGHLRPERQGAALRGYRSHRIYCAGRTCSPE